jgi:hypothetical protein
MDTDIKRPRRSRNQLLPAALHGAGGRADPCHPWRRSRIRVIRVQWHSATA